MHVGICEDEEIYAKLVTEKVRGFFQAVGEKVEWDLFPDGDPLLSHLTSGKKYDLILLDLQLEKSDGMEIAEKIRQVDKKIPIIFVTGMESRAAEGYGVEALDYVVKTDLDRRLDAALQRFWKKYKEDTLLLELPEGETVLLSYGDILWVESEKRGVKVVTAEKEYHSGSLPVGKLAEKLPEEFIEIHKSVYVQIKSIKRIGTDNIVTCNDVSLPLSRRRRKEVMLKVLETVKGRMA